MNVVVRQTLGQFNGLVGVGCCLEDVSTPHHHQSEPLNIQPVAHWTTETLRTHSPTHRAHMYLYITFQADGLLLLSRSFSFVIGPLTGAKAFASVTYEHR